MDDCRRRTERTSSYRTRSLHCEDRFADRGSTSIGSPSKIRLSPLPGVRPLRPLHGELPDLRRDLRRERQPARPDLPDARRGRRPARRWAPGPRAPGALPRLPGLRVGLPFGRPVRQDHRAVQDRACEARRRPRTAQPAPAADPPPPLPLLRAGQAALAPARLLQKLGVLDWAERIGLTRLLPPTLRRMQAMLPEARPGRATGCPRSCRRSGRSGRGSRSSSAASPTPCSPRPTRRRPASSSRTAARSSIPRGQVCCGAIHYHSGVEEPALELARQNIAAFDADGRRRDHRQRRRLRRDAQGLRPHPARRPSTTTAAGSSPRSRTSPSSSSPSGRSRRRIRVPLTVTYHDACHLCHGQQVRSQPRALARHDPGPGARPARGERDLLRRGGDLQPHPARDVRAARPPQDGPHRGDRRRDGRRPATSAASSRSPARSRSGAARSRSPTRSICSTGPTGGSEAASAYRMRSSARISGIRGVAARGPAEGLLARQFHDTCR